MKSNTGQYIKIAALVWAGCFAVFFLVFMLVLLPLNRRRNRIETEFSKIKTEADAAYIASLEQTKLRLNQEIETSNERLGDFVFTLERTYNLTYEIGSILSDIGLTGFDVNPTGQSVQAFSHCKYTAGQYFQVNFTASYQDFAKFLNALERYRPAIFIDTFSITQSRTDETKPTVNMSLAVLVAKNEKMNNAEG